MSSLMSCSLVSGVLFVTARIYSGDAYCSVYEVAMNKESSYSVLFPSPKYKREPTSVVIQDYSSKKKILSGLISPWTKLFS